MQKRKLAAIMFTDIQGYTAIMQRSEDKALQFRNKHREVFNRETEKYNGEILQYYGDGTLSVFDSAVDAVQCGIAIQRAMQEAPAVPVRIGIHSGDIIFTKDDIIGDGVNVASRIESLAVVGSVFISGKVYDEVKNSSAVETQFLKAFRLKNVERPVEVYAVSNPGLVVPQPEDISGKTHKGQPGSSIFHPESRRILVPSIFAVLLIAFLGYYFGSWWNDMSGPATKKVAVLPFEKAAGDESEAYFQAGMTDGLINELSKIDALKVLNQASTQFFIGLDGITSLISEQQNQVDYFVQGTLAKQSNQLRVDIELRKSLEGPPVWQQSYDRDIAESRQLWAEVATDLTNRMGIKTEEKAAMRRGNLRPVKPETYELYLKGTYYLNQSTPQEWMQGLVYLQEAVDRNPADAYAYAALAEGYISLGHGPDPPPDVFPKARAAAERAIQLDSNLANGWAALAHYHTYFGWDWELAEYAFNRANELNPNLAYNHYHRAWYLALFGRMTEAIEEHERAQELDPFTSLHTAWLGDLYRKVGRYEDGLREVEKVTKMRDHYALGLVVKGRILRDQNKLTLAIETLREAAAINPAWRGIYGGALIQAGRIEEGKSIINALESSPNAFSAMTLGYLYNELGNYDKAIEWFRFKEKHGWYPWIRINIGMTEIGKDPRFLELIREMGLPDPAPLEYEGEI